MAPKIGQQHRWITSLICHWRQDQEVIEVDFGLPAARIVRVLDQVIEWRGIPKVIRPDYGNEMCSAEFQTWAERRGIRLLFIQPGKPTQSTFVESFNGKFRDTC